MRYLLSSLLFVSAHAFAQPYAFLGVAHSTVKTDFGVSGDASPTLHVGGGYRFARLAFEASYLDTSRQTSVTSESGATTTIASVSTSKTKGLGLFALYRAPVAHSLHAFAKAGAYRLTNSMTTRAAEQDNAPPFNVRTLVDERRSESAWTPALGLGGELAIGGAAVRASLEVVKGGSIKRMRNVAFDVVFAF